MICCGEAILFHDLEKQTEKALFYLQEELWQYSFLEKNKGGLTNKRIDNRLNGILSF